MEQASNDKNGFLPSWKENLNTNRRGSQFTKPDQFTKGSNSCIEKQVLHYTPRLTTLNTNRKMHTHMYIHSVLTLVLYKDNTRRITQEFRRLSTEMYTCCEHQIPYVFKHVTSFFWVSRTLGVSTSGYSESVEMGTMSVVNNSHNLCKKGSEYFMCKFYVSILFDLRCKSFPCVMNERC